MIYNNLREKMTDHSIEIFIKINKYI